MNYEEIMLQKLFCKNITQLKCGYNNSHHLSVITNQKNLFCFFSLAYSKRFTNFLLMSPSVIIQFLFNSFISAEVIHVKPAPKKQTLKNCLTELF